MYGLEAIAANNGWAIAFVGASIVFSGLVFLSFAISRLHKILNMWEERDMAYLRIKTLIRRRKRKAGTDAKLDEHDPAETAGQFKMLADSLGARFSLLKLVELAEQRGLYRPHSAVNCLITSEVIEPDGKGFFLWNLQNYKKVIGEK